MNIEETRAIILAYLETNHPFFNHTQNTALTFNGNRYRIRPDDTFYYQNNALVIESLLSGLKFANKNSAS